MLSLGLLIFALSVSVFMSQNILSIERCEYDNEKIETSFKIVQISDLHNHEFGKSNDRLVRRIKKEQPDVIFMTGDMLNGDEEHTDTVENLIRELKKVADVYFSLGNHEMQYMEAYNGDIGADIKLADSEIQSTKQNEKLIQKLEKSGAIVLEKEFVDTEIHGQKVRIGGVYGYVLAEDYGDGSEQRFMEKFENTDRFKILLSHIPEGLLLWKSMEKWDVDLVFSGHVHGGQIRIPFIGGLFDPEEGFFPTYTKGMFQCGDGTMILSAGLGSSGMIPRVNNLPEITVCEIGNRKISKNFKSFDELPETHVIFITRDDVLGDNLPIYKNVRKAHSFKCGMDSFI